MEKLPMCRICLVQNVRMFVVANRTLRDLYEKLTDVPFVTEDSRPVLACFFCFAKLKQCYRLQIKCLEAEELFAQMMNEDYEVKPLINQDHLEVLSELTKSPTENISIVDEHQIEIIAIKEELPAVCERLVDIIEPKEEYESDELEPENLDDSCIDVADIPPHYSESDLEDDVPLMEFKTEVEEEQGVFKRNQRARETKRTTVAKKPKLDSRTTKLEDATTAEQTREAKSYSTFIRTIHKRTSKPGTYFKEPYKCDQSSFTQLGETPHKCDVCQRSFSRKSHLSQHIRIHTGKKPYKCDVCQRSFSQKGSLTRHNIGAHTSEKLYKCDICLRSFGVKDTLTKHIQIHTGEKPYECDVCQSSFNRKSNLSKHILIHTDKKPYKCDVCQCSFSLKSHLSQHILIHTGKNPYKCDVCQRGFSQKGSLTRHIRAHTGENLYKCDVCHRSFTKKSYLSQHIRMHIGEKPYKCDVCQRSFSQKVNLSQHICARRTYGKMITLECQK